MKDNLSPKLQNLLGDNLNNTFKGDKSQLTTIGIPIFEAMGGAEGIKALGGLQACIDLVKEFGDGDLKAGVNYIKTNIDTFKKSMDYGKIHNPDTLYEYILLDMASPSTNQQSLEQLNAIKHKAHQELENKLSIFKEEDVETITPENMKKVTGVGIENIQTIVGLNNIGVGPNKISLNDVITIGPNKIDALKQEVENRDTKKTTGIENVLRIGPKNVLMVGVDNIKELRSVLNIQQIGSEEYQLSPQELLDLGISANTATNSKDMQALKNLAIQKGAITAISVIKKIGASNIKAMGGIANLGSVENILILSTIMDDVLKVGIENINALGGVTKLRASTIHELALIGKDAIDKIGAKNIATLFYNDKEIANNIEQIKKLILIGKDAIDKIGINNVKDIRNVILDPKSDNIETINQLCNLGSKWLDPMDPLKLNPMIAYNNIEIILSLSYDHRTILAQASSANNDFPVKSLIDLIGLDNIEKLGIDNFNSIRATQVAFLGIDNLISLNLKSISDPTELSAKIKAITFLNEENIYKISGSSKDKHDIASKRCLDLINSMTTSQLASLSTDIYNGDLSYDLILKLSDNDPTKLQSGITITLKLYESKILNSPTELLYALLQDKEGRDERIEMMARLGNTILSKIDTETIKKFGAGAKNALYEGLKILDQIGKERLELIGADNLKYISYEELLQIFGKNREYNDKEKYVIQSKIQIMKAIKISSTSGTSDKLDDVLKSIPELSKQEEQTITDNYSEFNPKATSKEITSHLNEKKAEYKLNISKLIALYGLDNIKSLGGASKDTIKDGLKSILEIKNIFQTSNGFNIIIAAGVIPHPINSLTEIQLNTLKTNLEKKPESDSEKLDLLFKRLTLNFRIAVHDIKDPKEKAELFRSVYGGDVLLILTLKQRVSSAGYVLTEEDKKQLAKIENDIIVQEQPFSTKISPQHLFTNAPAVTAPTQQKPVNELEGVTLSKDLIIKIGEERIANYLNSSTSPIDKKTRIENVNGLSTLPEYKINELPKMQDTLYEIFQNNLLDYIRDPSVSTSTRATSTSSGVVNTGEGVSSASHRFRSFTQSIGDLLKPLKQFTTTTQTSTTADVSSGSPSTRTNDLIKAMEDELKMFSNSSKQPVVDAKQGTGSTDPNINHDSRLASYNPKPVKFGSPTAAASTLSNLQANQQQPLGQEKPQQPQQQKRN